MKRMIVISVFLIFLLQMVLSCVKGDENNSVSSKENLVSLAKQDGQVVVYSISTRIEEAAKKFEEKYGIKVVWENLDGGELLSRVNVEVRGGTSGADVIIAQDSGRLQMELIDADLVENYIPDIIRSDVSLNDLNPLVHQYVNKVLMISGDNDEEKITNVWQLTEERYKEKIYYKDPFIEDVNLNFLTMITANDLAEKLEKSYLEYVGEPLKLSPECENAGYEFIKRIAKNVRLGTSDTLIASIVGSDTDSHDAYGLFVYSKTRYAATGDYTLIPLTEVKPFAGFMYPVYILMTKNAKHSNASKLFIQYLMTEEGFEPWSDNVGAYSSNHEIDINEGDFPLSFWRERLVVEDGLYVSQNITKVTNFINNLTSE